MTDLIKDLERAAGRQDIPDELCILLTEAITQLTYLRSITGGVSKGGSFREIMPERDKPRDIRSNAPSDREIAQGLADAAGKPMTMFDQYGNPLHVAEPKPV